MKSYKRCGQFDREINRNGQGDKQVKEERGNTQFNLVYFVLFSILILYYNFWPNFAAK
jgi:hypothetical protein